MNKRQIFLVLFILFGSIGLLMAQVDSDGDLNADITDPWPNDPTQGGVFPGCTITYNVTLAGDLDATGFTGDIITITTNGITFNGNEHIIISPNSHFVIHLISVSNVIVQNVNAPNGTGEGIRLHESSNNIVRKCDFTGRTIMLISSSQGLGGGNLIENNKSGGIQEYNNGLLGWGNQIINNDCSGSNFGIAVSGASVVQGNNLSGINGCGLYVNNFSTNWGLNLTEVVDQNSFSGTSDCMKIWGVVTGTTIENLDFTSTGISSIPLEIWNADHITLRHINISGLQGGPASLLLGQITNSVLEDITGIGGSGEGLRMHESSNNTIRNCDFSNHGTGIMLISYTQGIGGGNIIESNTFSECGIALREYNNGLLGWGNQFLNNDCSGSSGGIEACGANIVRGNNLSGIKGCGISLSTYSSGWGLNLREVLSQNSYTGTYDCMKFWSPTFGTIIEDLDFTITGIVRTPLEIWNADHLILRRLNISGLQGSPASLLLGQVNSSSISDIIGIGGSGEGLRIHESSNNTFRNCNFSQHGSGIMLIEKSSNNLIENNILISCGLSIYGYNEKVGVGNKILNNNCSNSDGGILTCVDMEIRNNNLQGISGWGLILGYYSFNWNMSLQDYIIQNDFRGASRCLWLTVPESGIVIEDLDFTQIGIMTQALMIDNAENITLRRLNLSGFPEGLSLTNVNKSLIEELNSSGNGQGGIGLFLTTCSENIIRNSTFSNHGNPGIMIVSYQNEKGGSNQIENNDCRFNNHGILMVDYANMGSNNTIANNNCSNCGCGFTLIGCNNLYNNTALNCDLYALQLIKGLGSKIYHNNFSRLNNGINEGISDEPIELSFNNEGNYWGHSCEDQSLFEPGVDSNSPDVVDSHPYGIADGWLNPQISPGCPLIKNLPPIANAGLDSIVEMASPSGSEVFLDGSGSSDPDNDALTFTWSENGNVIAGPTQETKSKVTLAFGTHNIILNVEDGKGGSSADSVVIKVQDTKPPVLSEITAPIDPIQVGTEITTSVSFTDQWGTHTAVWSWGDESNSDGTVTESNGSGTIAGTHVYSNPGVYTVRVTVSDQSQNSANGVFQYVVVFNPDAGFVTGGGWINSPQGAYTPEPNLTGKANFGFVSKYKKGSSVPTGDTQFQFKTGNLNFKSTSYEWLVIAGAKAKYKGSGTINNAGDYAFMLSAIDGDWNKKTDPDRFRIKIWLKDAGAGVVYDNQMGAADDADATMVIGGGSIQVHSQGLAKGMDVEGSEETITIDMPKEFALFQNYPNPFNPETHIQYSLPKASTVSLRVFDVAGRMIRTLKAGNVSAGLYEIIWDGRNDMGNMVPTGIYIARLDAGPYTFMKKMAFMK